MPLVVQQGECLCMHARTKSRCATVDASDVCFERHVDDGWHGKSGILKCSSCKCAGRPGTETAAYVHPSKQTICHVEVAYAVLDKLAVFDTGAGPGSWYRVVAGGTGEHGTRNVSSSPYVILVHGNLLRFFPMYAVQHGLTFTAASWFLH